MRLIIELSKNSLYCSFYATIGQLLKQITKLQTLDSTLKTASFLLQKVSYICVGPFMITF